MRDSASEMEWRVLEKDTLCFSKSAFGLRMVTYVCIYTLKHMRIHQSDGGRHLMSVFGLPMITHVCIYTIMHMCIHKSDGGRHLMSAFGHHMITHMCIYTLMHMRIHHRHTSGVEVILAFLLL